VNDPEPDPRFAPPPALVPLAPALMMAFWALLGAAAGIKATQGVWHALGWGGGVSVAVPVGGVAGAIVGALLGLITRPQLLVLLMAVFAGASAGAVAGQLAWGDLGGIAGQAAGGLVGAAAWATWLFVGRGRRRPVGDGDTLVKGELGTPP
jgi:hypothetical protein